MKQILRLFLVVAVASAHNVSARIDLLWETPIGTAKIPDFEASQSGMGWYIGGQDGSLALKSVVKETIYWFDGSGNLVSAIDLRTIQMPDNKKYGGGLRFLYASSTSLISRLEVSLGNRGSNGVMVCTKTPQGVDHEFFSSEGQSNFTGTDNALIRIESGKLKRYRFVDDQPVAPANQPVLGSIRTNDRYLLLDYAVAPKQKYYLGISKNLKTWEPLYDFTPASGQLSIELPRIILGDHSFLKLD